MMLDKGSNVASQQPSQKEEDNFFDLLSRFQSGRMDDQRCALNTKHKSKYRAITPEASDMEDKYVKVYHLATVQNYDNVMDQIFAMNKNSMILFSEMEKTCWN